MLLAMTALEPLAWVILYWGLKVLTGLVLFVTLVLLAYLLIGGDE